MIQIIVNGETLDIPRDFSLDIEESSPIFNDTGSASISVELPATDRNRRIFGFPSRPDAIGGSCRGIRCTVYAGPYIRSGVINVDGATESSVTVNIGFDNSIAYDAWKAKPLSKVNALPCYKIEDLYEFSKFIADLYYRGKPKVDDLAVFPVCVALDTIEKDEVEKEYPEVLNSEGCEPFYYPQYDGREVVRVIDNEPTKVTVPYGYGCSPFVKVWKILECVFLDLGLKLDCNPFKEDTELARLVVLNNTADAICNKTLDYAELMPDCSVEEFLHALFVRFGLVYRTDFDAGVVHLRLLRDIIRETSSMDLDAYLSEPIRFDFRTPQYVRLSAGSTIEGAAPMTERFEDFMKDLGQKMIYVAICPELWVSGTKPAGYLAVIEKSYTSKVPEPSEEEASVTPSAIDRYCQAISRQEKPDDTQIGYSWNPTSGKWFRDSSFKEQRTSEESSSFFVWDPQPEGYEPLDMSSADEWCPIGSIVVKQQQLFAPDIRVAIPMFLVGSRHFHTYLENEGKQEKEGCPLSFMFALTGFCGANETVGRLGADGGLYHNAALFADGSTHDLSLYFQFRNGLYARFWKDFDMMLRNADRTATLSISMDIAKLQTFDILRPVTAGGIMGLIDRADIKLDDSRKTNFEMTMIPAMQHPGKDGFARELPYFPPIHRVL